ncbi:LOW QUALITY PROTEIN: hypothetical protein ACHAWF_000529, partial [Thalassiosira exigua]
RLPARSHKTIVTDSNNNYFLINNSTKKSCQCALLKGEAHAKNPVEYQGVSTPLSERDELGLRGLLPATYLPLKLEVERCISRLREKPDPLEQYIYLRNIQDVNENLFYALLIQHTAELMPIVYTARPSARRRYSHIYRGALRGLYLSIDDSGHVRKILDNWPYGNVTTIVVTDGERILGLGDLGVNGMGIPIGKLALYSARERGPTYDALVAEFVSAVRDKFGANVLIQFGDFGNANAFRLLDCFKDSCTCFNNDIQGTA